MSLIAAIPPPPGRGFDIGPLTIRDFDIGPLTIRYYGILIAIGALIAITMARRRYEALGGDPDLADRVAFGALLLGFVGARIAYVLPRLDEFAGRPPWAVFAIWEGGIALYGGLTVGFLTGAWLLRRWHGDLPAFADAVAPAVPIAQAIGRWGNYFNQELYGTPTDLPWALEVDSERVVDAYEGFSTFHPTFLYESLWNLALAGFLIWLDRRRVLPRGALLLLYFIGYATARFGLELLRTDTTDRYLGLSRNAWFSLAVAVGATVGLMIWARRRGSATEADEPAAPAESEASAEPAEPTS